MKKYILFAALMVIASACEKEPAASVFDGEFLVYTARSEDAVDFSGFDTFTVADSLLAIDGDRSGMFLDGWAKSIRNMYIDEMESRGYEYVETKEEADLGIQISYVVSTSYLTAYYPTYPWWLDCPGYWHPWYWGDWGSWSYAFPVTYGYSTQSLLTDIVDLTGDTGDDKSLPVVWNSFIDGSMGDANFDLDRFGRAIAQSFEQSEYIGK